MDALVADSGENASEKAMTIPGRWDIPYEYSAGAMATRFFRTIQNDMAIIGSKCPECRWTLVPPRSFCERCFVPIEDTVLVGPGGVLQAFTIVAAAFPGMPKPPYIVAYVQLDGASTSLVNFLSGVDLEDVVHAARSIAIGSRVLVTYEKVREGRMTDFSFVLE